MKPSTGFVGDRRFARGMGTVLVLAAVVLLAPVARAEDGGPPGGTAAPAPGPSGAPVPLEEAAPSVEVFPEILVEAPTLTRRPIQESTAAVNAITKVALDRVLPRSTADAFIWNPGLWNTQGSAGHMGTPVIRGLTGNQVLFLLDGVRLSNDRTPPGPSGYWEMVDMEVVDHIEVVRSPDSVHYGSQAIGGVTAFYTGWPIDYTCGCTQLGGRARLLAGFGGEPMNRFRLEGRMATPRTRLVVGGTLVRAEDLESPTGVLHPTNYDADNGDIRFEWRATRTGTLGVSFFSMWKEWRGNFVFPNRDQSNTRDREVAIVRWNERSWSPLWDDIELRAAVVHYGQWYKRYERDLSEEWDVWTPQLDVIAHKRLCGGRHLLTYGLQAYRDIVDTTNIRAGVITKPIPDAYFQTLGVYVQDEWDVTSRLRLTGGLRFDVANASTDPDAATTDPLIDPQDVDIDEWDTAITGRLGALYRATRWLDLVANASRGYRFPSLENLCGFLQHPDEISVGNPDVKPEYSWNVEGGVNVTTRRFRGSAVFFYSWYDDLIIATYGVFKGQSWIDRNGNGVEDPDESIYLTSNAGTAHTHGVELEGEYLVLPRCGLYAFGNFTWWQGTFDPSPTEPLGLPTNATVGLRWVPSKKLWVEGSAHMVRHFNAIDPAFYYSEQFFFKDPQDGDKGTLRSDVNVPGYTIFDVRAGLELRKGTVLTVGIENIGDKKYRPYGGRHDGPSTTFLVSLSAEI